MQCDTLSVNCGSGSNEMLALFFVQYSNFLYTGPLSPLTSLLRSLFN